MTYQRFLPSWLSTSCLSTPPLGIANSVAPQAGRAPGAQDAGTGSPGPIRSLRSQDSGFSSTSGLEIRNPILVKVPKNVHIFSLLCSRNTITYKSRLNFSSKKCEHHVLEYNDSKKIYMQPRTKPRFGSVDNGTYF